MADNVDRYGYASLANLWLDRPTDSQIPMVMDAIRARAAIYSTNLNSLLDTFAMRTVRYQERFLLPGSGTLQPIDSRGVPLPVKPAGHYDVAFPIYGGGTASARDRIAREMETVADIFRDQEDAEARDGTWLRKQLLSALFTPTTRTYVDEQWGSLTVQPLALTSDSVSYVRNTGVGSTAQHYLAQAAAIATGAATNPFPVIYNALSAHPSNQGREILVFVATDQVADIEGLTSFYPVSDPDIRAGASTDVLIPSGAGFRRFGDKVLGKADNCWIIHWSALPANYLLAVVDGRPPLRMREYPAAGLQGFFPEFDLVHGAFPERRFLRYCGFGVADRVSALAYFVEAGDTTYDVPAGFTAPVAN